ncbi:30S ribosomal protein S16 [Borreliella burgdorferi]|uniref:Small ribosomal subunit protein bS16 n=4 Tax=Borreliella burgdorferi TaxID=139 RepID=RS16_BORBU|nr:30S ribosomal protein S16 [Borreliella burgdorferi]B7J2Q0.1 RecName: Full=Small ribosomal subunit protein bS16; AltName: Full=30S ribosomal protein S16 [Borreliella burgdorferi ZS7]O51638.1 RecName: Full=Small ribosomal subunit protein bS16; AltName: Full=30S ribosomal protein S16 [Borreliella burgdorferi B31]AGS66694.1 30S ribosomal protein S16 [Borreliella burgdorferi CA382]EOA80061.1 30S ribosomal protein S16 [Borreliella burgdorferi CA8]AAC67048.1 ribosomal protein S16 [Borreliella burg
MSVKIRLKRMGAKKRPYYRVVVMNSTSPRDGRAIEELGYYHPVEKQNQIKIKEDRMKDWISKGAILSDTVKMLLNKNNLNAKSQEV